MRRWQVGSIVAVASTLAALGAGEPGDEPFPPISFEEACAQAGEHRKLVLVEATTAWSGDGQRMRQTTWRDGELLAWLRANAIAVRIDADDDAPWALAHRIAQFPTVLLFSPDGVELVRVAGFKEAAGMLAELDAAARKYREQPAASRPAGATGERNPLARHLSARRLAERGEHEAALREYLWCLDEGPRVDPQYAGVRNSLLIRQIVELGQPYPPALQALQERRDAAAERIETGKEHAGDVTTFASINRQLGEDNRTLSLYDELLTRPVNSDTLRQLARLCFGPLLVQRRYRDIQLGNPDLFEQAMAQFEYYRESGALADRYPGLTPEQFRRSRLETLRDKVGQYYEVLAGIGETDNAARLADKLLQIDASADTYLTLARHAHRSGRPRAADVDYARQADKARDGRDAAALAILAELMAMTGQVDPAVTLLQERMGTFEGAEAEHLRRLLHKMPKYAVYRPSPPTSAPSDQRPSPPSP